MTQVIIIGGVFLATTAFMFGLFAGAFERKWGIMSLSWTITALITFFAYRDTAGIIESNAGDADVIALYANNERLRTKVILKSTGETINALGYIRDERTVTVTRLYYPLSGAVEYVVEPKDKGQNYFR